MHRKFIGSQSGEFNWVTAFLMLIMAALLFAAVQIGPMYIANYGLRQELYLLMVNAKNQTDQQIIVKLTAFAAERGIPLGAEQTTCQRLREEKIHCQYDYHWPVTVSSYRLFDLPFHEEIDRPITNVIR